MDVDRRYYNKNVGTSSTDYANIDLQPGYQRLTGKQALDFVRFRHTDSDLYRLARQQLFVCGDAPADRQVARAASSLVGIVNTITQHHYLEIGRRRASGSTSARVAATRKFAYGLPPATSSRSRSRASPARTSSPPPRPTSPTRCSSFLNPDVEAWPRLRPPSRSGGRCHARKRTIAAEAGHADRAQRQRASPARPRTRATCSGQKGYIAVAAAERPARQRAELELLPLEGLLRPDAAGQREAGRRTGRPLVGSADVEPMPANLRRSRTGRCSS